MSASFYCTIYWKKEEKKQGMIYCFTVDDDFLPHWMNREKDNIFTLQQNTPKTNINLTQECDMI